MLVELNLRKFLALVTILEFNQLIPSDVEGLLQKIPVKTLRELFKNKTIKHWDIPRSDYDDVWFREFVREFRKGAKTWTKMDELLAAILEIDDTLLFGLEIEGNDIGLIEMLASCGSPKSLMAEYASRYSHDRLPIKTAALIVEAWNN